MGALMTLMWTNRDELEFCEMGLDKDVVFIEKR